MLRISQLKLPVTHTQEQLEKKLLKMLRMSRKDLGQYYIRKRSLDARKKPELYYVYSIDVEIKNEERVLKSMKGKVQKVSVHPYCVPEHGTERLSDRPVIIGSGPAGFLSLREAHRYENAEEMWKNSGRQECLIRLPMYSSGKAVPAHSQTAN